MAWVHTALAIGSWFLLWIEVEPRTEEQAALIVQVAPRTREMPFWLTDEGKAYTAALLQVVGVV